MKSVLIVLTQPNITQLQTNESLSAALVMASFGCQTTILLKDAALSLLQDDLTFNKNENIVKPASSMRESLEFYDIETIYIQKQDSSHPYVLHSKQHMTYIDFNVNFLQTFDHILYW